MNIIDEMLFIFPRLFSLNLRKKSTESETVDLGCYCGEVGGPRCSWLGNSVITVPAVRVVMHLEKDLIDNCFQ